MKSADMKNGLDQVAKSLRLPPDFVETARRYYLPLAEYAARLSKTNDRFRVIGINGAQGSGKSTLAETLRTILETFWGLRVVVLSIDDIYLTKAKRRKLSETIHPLLATRGVPGTHDLDLGCEIMENLLTADAQSRIPIPRFDKAADDRCDEKNWPVHRGPVDIILFEGWCVGAVAQSSDALAGPVNELERLEDADGTWRRYVNDMLTRDYQRLFSRIDLLVMLQVPSLDCVRNWRTLQEEKLKAACGGKGTGLMSPAEILRFIRHYERLTLHMLDEMPGRADCLFRLGPDHSIVSVRAPYAAETAGTGA